jgi:hypothetical protein
MKKAKVEFCRWRQDVEGDWMTGCKNIFVLIHGTPAENDMRYCCYCGKRIEGGN